MYQRLWLTRRRTSFEPSQGLPLVAYAFALALASPREKRLLAWQDATSNSELLRGVATQPVVEQRVLCAS